MIMVDYGSGWLWGRRSARVERGAGDGLDDCSASQGKHHGHLGPTGQDDDNGGGDGGGRGWLKVVFLYYQRFPGGGGEEAKLHPQRWGPEEGQWDQQVFQWWWWWCWLWWWMSSPPSLLPLWPPSPPQTLAILQTAVKCPASGSPRIATLVFSLLYIDGYYPSIVKKRMVFLDVILATVSVYIYHDIHFTANSSNLSYAFFSFTLYSNPLSAIYIKYCVSEK